MSIATSATAQKTPQGWTTAALGDLAEYINGRAFKPAEWATEGLPIIRIQNLTNPEAEANRFAGELDARHRIDDGDLLVSWSASLDAFVWNRGPAALNQHIFKVQEDNALVDREFFYFALKAAMSGIRGQVHGSTMQHITKPKFEATRVQIPSSLDEQRRIAGEIHERLRVATAISRAAQRQLEAAEAESGAIIHRALEQAHQGTVDELPLGEVLEWTQYGSSTAANRDGEGVPMIRMGNVVANRLSLVDLVHVDLSTEEIEKYRLQRGDILINRTNSAELVGKSALFEEDGLFVFASYLIRLRPQSNRCLSEYLQAVWSSSIGRRYVDKKKHQSVGQANINATEIKEMPFPLPSLDKQKTVLATLSEAAPVVDRMCRAARAGVAAADSLGEAVLREVFAPEVPEDEDTDG